MMTINTAQHFGVERDLGCLAPGRCADLVLADDLEAFAAGTVIVGGEVAAEAGRLLLDLPRPEPRAALSAVGADSAPPWPRQTSPWRPVGRGARSPPT